MEVSTGNSVFTVLLWEMHVYLPLPLPLPSFQAGQFRRSFQTQVLRVGTQSMGGSSWFDVCGSRCIPSVWWCHWICGSTPTCHSPTQLWCVRCVNMDYVLRFGS